MAMSAWMRSSLCRKIGPHVQGLFEVAVALFDDPLVFVDAEYVERGERAPGWVGQVGGQGVEPVVGGCAGDGVRVAVPSPRSATPHPLECQMEERRDRCGAQPNDSPGRIDLRPPTPPRAPSLRVLARTDDFCVRDSDFGPIILHNNHGFSRGGDAR